MLYRVEEVAFPAGFIAFGFVNFSCLFWYRRFLGLSRGKSVLLWLVALATAAAIFTYHVARSRSSFQVNEGDEFEAIVLLSGVGCLAFFAFPFIAKLYLKWIGGLLTAEEKTAGINGMRAWLSAGNLICAFLLSLCAWFGYGYSFWGIFAITLAALLAYPAVRNGLQPGAGPEIKNEALPDERERILKLLEEGKINAAEAASLLNALGQSAESRQGQPPPDRKLILIGAALALVGFFLPWFSCNPGQELSRQMQNVAGDFPQHMAGAELQMPFKLKTESFSMNGGDIQRGLGWLVLGLGIVAALLPFVATALDGQTRKMLSLASLGFGSIILFYLLAQNFRFSGIGIFMVLAGFALELLGTLKEQ